MPPICTPDGGARVTNHGEWNGGLPRRNNTRNLALEQLATADLQRTNLDRQWVAQLSSKYIGVRDPLQETRSGSHTFYAVDILAEHQDLRYRFDGQYDVRLLRGQDFSTGMTYNGETLWYTFLLGNFGSRSAVESFCSSAFPGLSGNYLKNQCLPRTLKP
jgi:hypothetical protein